jgi:lysozyme
MIDKIVDVYHQNNVDFAALKQGGIIAVIHKATEGSTFKDAEFTTRQSQAKALGLLWGAYHYSSGASVSDQVENFLQHAKPADNHLVALDWESSTNGPDMTLEQAHRFVEMVKAELGRWPLIYGGRLLREQIGTKTDAVFANCPLWYSRYAEAPIGIPTGTWSTYTLWQFTDGSAGPEPHQTPGVGRCDRDRFQGGEAELKNQWPFTRRDEGIELGPGAGMIIVPASAAKAPRRKKAKHT